MIIRFRLLYIFSFIVLFSLSNLVHAADQNGKGYTLDPCCPPINKERIAGLTQWAKPPPNVQGKYRLQLNKLLPDFDAFDNDMQAYANLHLGMNNNGADKLVTVIQYYTHPGFSASSKVHWDYFCWKKGGNTNSTGGSNALNGGCGALERAMNPNGFDEGQQYWMKIYTFLEGPGTGWIMDYIPQKCDKDQILKFQWSFSSTRTTEGNAAFQIMDSAGKVIK